MTTINQSELTNILKLVAGLFNAAPGKEYLNEFTEAYIANGRNLEALADSMGQTNAFKSIYPSFLTVEAFTTQFLTTLGLQDNEEAQAFVATKVAAGESFASVIYQSLVALVESTSDAFAAARDQLSNKAAVAEHFSVTLGRSSDDLAVLQGAIAGVTDDPATVEAAEKANEAGANEGQTFTLTTDPDTLTGTAGDDTFRALKIGTDGTLQSSDILDGGAGYDVLNISAGGIAGDGTAPVIRNIERINNSAVGKVTSGSPGNYNNGSSLDLALVTGVQEIWSDFTGVASGAALYTNASLDTVFGLTGSTATSNGLEISFAAGELEGDSTLNLALAGNNGYVGLGFKGEGDEIEHLVVDVAEGNDGSLGLSALQFETITLTGDGDLIVLGGDSAVELFDASAATGDISWGIRADGRAAPRALTKEAVILGGSGDNVFNLADSSGALTIDGGAGNDTLIGGSGDDLIIAGTGENTLTGGDGADTFVLTISGTAAASLDVITDFRKNGDDVIDFGLDEGSEDNFMDVDAVAESYVQALTFANTVFASDGDLQYAFVNNGKNGEDEDGEAIGWLFVNADGDGTADGAVQLTGVTEFDFAYIIGATVVAA